MEKEYEMIPKDQMIDGMWYNGICRNTRFAMWDKKVGKFRYLRNKFGWFMEQIEHFEDVKETRLDGFIPVKKLKSVNEKILCNIRHDVGY